jgi:acetolactate synthase-1/2/3 large subunit
MATCGELLVQLLEAYGVDMVFGIPGVHTVELYRGLPMTHIRHVTPRHEQGAGFMADGYARVSGKPGVCFIITGPGMTNILTAMGQAYADSVPMLVISSVNRTEELAMGDGRLHELPSQRNMVAGVAAFSHTLLRPEQLPQVIARAFAVFRSGRPRPVHIEIPIDVITMQVRAEDIVAPRTIPLAPAPRRAELEQAVAWLRDARSPLLILGGGAADAADAAKALAEHLDAPVIHTANAKGILPPGHPLRAGENMAYSPIHQAIREADLVLAVGTEFGETEMYPDPKPFVFDGRLIRIDIDPEQLVRGFGADLPIVADAGAALAEINRALGIAATRADGNSAGARRSAAIRQAAKAHWWPAVHRHQRIIEVVSAALPDMILVGDSAEHVYALNQSYEAPRPRSYFSSSTGYGTLGYGLPAGLGAKLAAPDRPVVVLAGDGGLQFTIGELAAAVEARVPLIVLLWNNDGYGEIKNYMVGRQIQPIGVDIFTPDFQTIARGFGCEARRPDSYETLGAEMKAAATRDKPTIIELRADDPWIA